MKRLLFGLIALIMAFAVSAQVPIPSNGMFTCYSQAGLGMAACHAVFAQFDLKAQFANTSVYNFCEAEEQDAYWIPDPVHIGSDELRVTWLVIPSDLTESLGLSCVPPLSGTTAIGYSASPLDCTWAEADIVTNPVDQSVHCRCPLYSTPYGVVPGIFDTGTGICRPDEIYINPFLPLRN
jgi:hypothetical protein